MNIHETYLRGLECISFTEWCDLVAGGVELDKGRLYRLNYMGTSYVINFFQNINGGRWRADDFASVLSTPNLFPDIFKNMVECDIP